MNDPIHWRIRTIFPMNSVFIFFFFFLFLFGFSMGGDSWWDVAVELPTSMCRRRHRGRSATERGAVTSRWRRRLPQRRCARARTFHSQPSHRRVTSRAAHQSRPCRRDDAGAWCFIGRRKEITKDAARSFVNEMMEVNRSVSWRDESSKHSVFFFLSCAIILAYLRHDNRLSYYVER